MHGQKLQQFPTVSVAVFFKSFQVTSMPILAVLPLAIAASFAATPNTPLVQPLATAPSKATRQADAIPSPKLTEMRVTVGAEGEPKVHCREVSNPKYKQALEQARNAEHEQ
jgi:hypothetical protein